MDRELASRRPATIIAGRDVYTLPRTEIMTADFHQREELYKRIHHMVRAGEISRNYAEAQTGRGWAVKVVRLKEGPKPRPRWIKPLVLCLAALAGVALAGAAVVWAVLSMLGAAAAAVAGLSGPILILIVLGVLGLAGFGARAVTVITKVTVK